MCRPDNMPTLCKAVDEVVADFISKGEDFSAHDVTGKIRSTDYGWLVGIDSAETGTVHVDGADVAKIDHEIVKEAVHDLFQRDEMTGYGRAHSGGFWLYTKSVDVDPVDDDVVDDSSNGTPYDGNSSL